MKQVVIFKKSMLLILLCQLFIPTVCGQVGETEMAKEMSKVSQQLKLLRKIPRDDYDAAALAVRNAHKAMLSAMQYTPVMVEEMKDGSEKLLALAGSRQVLGLSYAALCELEIAYLKKDPSMIQQAMEKVKAAKKSGHQKYTDD
jgi:hypothetical protein